MLVAKVSSCVVGGATEDAHVLPNFIERRSLALAVAVAVAASPSCCCCCC